MKPELWPLHFRKDLYTRRGLVTALRDVSFCKLGVRIPLGEGNFFFSLLLLFLFFHESIDILNQAVVNLKSMERYS